MNTSFRNTKVIPITAKRIAAYGKWTGKEVKGEAKDCCFSFKQDDHISWFAETSFSLWQEKS